jgi:hypothetical protein
MFTAMTTPSFLRAALALGMLIAATGCQTTEPFKLSSNSATVFLKSGKQIQAADVEESDTTTRVRTADGKQLVFGASEIERVENTAASRKITITEGTMDDYFYNGQEMNQMDHFEAVFGQINNAQVNNSFSSSKTWFTVANVFGGVGGAMIGWPIGQAIGGGKFNTPLFAAGVAVAGIGFALLPISRSNLADAVRAYNKTADAPKTGFCAPSVAPSISIINTGREQIPALGIHVTF